MALATLAETRIRAQSLTVFGTEDANETEPQGTETKAFCEPETALTAVHALVERRHAQGLGPRQDGSSERSAKYWKRERLRAWIAIEGVGRETGKRPLEIENRISQQSRLRAKQAERQNKASAKGRRETCGSGGRMPVRAPVTKPDAEMPLGACQRNEPSGEIWRFDRERSQTSDAKRVLVRVENRLAGRTPKVRRPRVGESGVGSDAGPICFYDNVSASRLIPLSFHTLIRATKRPWDAVPCVIALGSARKWSVCPHA